MANHTITVVSVFVGTYLGLLWLLGLVKNPGDSLLFHASVDGLCLGIALFGRAVNTTWRRGLQRAGGIYRDYPELALR